jgi:hypothetical protein
MKSQKVLAETLYCLQSFFLEAHNTEGNTEPLVEDLFNNDR